MAIDWASDHFVRLYTRETEDDLLLSWEARAVWNELLKKFDKQGDLVARKGARTIAALIRYPVEVVERALPDLLEDGRLERNENGYRAPNYHAANYTPRSSAARKAYSRLATQIGHEPVVDAHTETPRHAETRSHTESHAEMDPAGDSRKPDNKMSRDATPSHTGECSRDKTSIRSDQGRSEHTQSRARARSGARKSPIRPDWTPSKASVERARVLGVDLEPAVAEFVAYWRSEGKAKADWDQAFEARLVELGERRKRKQPLPEERRIDEL